MLILIWYLIFRTSLFPFSARPFALCHSDQISHLSADHNFPYADHTLSFLLIVGRRGFTDTPGSLGGAFHLKSWPSFCPHRNRHPTFHGGITVILPMHGPLENIWVPEFRPIRPRWEEKPKNYLTLIIAFSDLSREVLSPLPPYSRGETCAALNQTQPQMSTVSWGLLGC